MPCMSYDDRPDYDARDWKKKTDKLARIACKVLTSLAENDKSELLVQILKDDEVREWWEAHQAADRLAKAAKAELERKAKIKRDALAKLTDEEKKILGIKR